MDNLPKEVLDLLRELAVYVPANRFDLLDRIEAIEELQKRADVLAETTENTGEK